MEITMTLRGKRALVTGASRGIGVAIAKTLAYEGADVAITYEKSAESAAEVVSAIEAKGRRGVATQTDSADAAAVQASVDTAVAELGGLDILFNNAGILRLGELKDISLADIDALLNVNVRAPFIAIKAALAHLVKGGRVITIGSYDADRVLTPILSAYAATKSALAAFTKALARELGPKEVTVNLHAAGLYRHRHVPGKRPARGDSQTIHGIRSVWRSGGHRRCGGVPGVREGSIHPGSTLTVDGGANA
jgi:3-oxoacyl-[acyl-carrier protein] reductase